MAVKMRKWSPWTAAAAATTRKFQVAAKPLKLEGLPEEAGDGETPMAEKLMAIKIKWKGEPKFFPLIAPFQSKPKKELSNFQKVPKNGSGIIQWDDDQWFQNTCCFSVVSNHDDSKFGVWEISFNVLYGDSKAKMTVVGRVSMNISEIAWKMEKSSVEEKLHLSLLIDGFPRDVTLTVLLNFVEVREAHDSVATTRLDANEFKKNVKARRRSPSLEEVSLDDSDELNLSDTKDAQISLSTRSRSPGRVLDSDKKETWFWWTSRRLSIKRAKTKEEKPESSSIDDAKVDADQRPTESPSTDSFSNRAIQEDPEKACPKPENQEDTWEEKEVTSRDGQAKVKAPVFFASFDQRSDKAAGESACTALVAVISHWLHSNSNTMPTRTEFDNLIMQGSCEWRKLCEDVAYVTDFPNKHFDLETIVQADIRPVSISHRKSFVGFFGAKAFEALKGAMSFDDIWDEISSNIGVYIVSWNDHFFVLKAETDAYYIIDTLGERLYEGCNQAYVLRFDDKAIMKKLAQTKTEMSENEGEAADEEVICSGKECCREFIKRFLAAIPLKELEEEEKKSAVSYFALHQRLQIEFNYSFLASPISSLTSSPLSSLASSPFSE
ncbi:hypothetical protein ACS0TY_021074 [Phlomoides rotata]